MLALPVAAGEEAMWSYHCAQYTALPKAAHQLIALIA